MDIFAAPLHPQDGEAGQVKDDVEAIDIPSLVGADQSIL